MPMTMERFVKTIPAPHPMPVQMYLPIILDVTNGENRFVLGLFQDRHSAKQAVHHLRNGVFLDGRRMKRLETKGLAVLKDIDFGNVVRKMLGTQPVSSE
jgi:hypothetical protein